MYKDFRAAVLEIMSAQSNQEAELNGVSGMGMGVDDIPGSIVSVDTAPSPQKVVTAQPTAASAMLPQQLANAAMGQTVPENPGKGPLPPVLFIIGGPGSNKASLCLKTVGLNPGWTHFRYAIG